MNDSVCRDGTGERSVKFDPGKLIYDRWGIPILSVPQIEEVATEFLKTYCPEVLKTPRMTPVVEMLNKLRARTELSTEIVDLGYKGNSKVIGRVNFRRKKLYLDKSLLNSREAAFRFTAAHEIGHWILHRYNYENWKLEKYEPVEKDLEHDDQSLYFFSSRCPRAWLEFQAKVFAASVVTPRQTFADAISEAQQGAGVKLSDLRLSPPSAEMDLRAFEELVVRISQIYQVSKKCIRIRMKTLGVLNDFLSDGPRTLHCE